jgi:hypothetical protein
MPFLQSRGDKGLPPWHLLSALSFLLLSVRQLRPDEGAADEDGTEFLGKSAR